MITAITGGIGSGKSAVSAILARLGYTVIDADQLSRDVTKKGRAALRHLTEAFGKEILTEKGELNRKKLASICFPDPEKTETLNKIVRTAIAREFRRRYNAAVKDAPGGMVFYEVPMLFEAGDGGKYDRVWLVTAPEEVRVRRVLKRDSAMDREAVLQRMRLQMSDAEKAKLSDAVIVNDGDLEKLETTVKDLLVVK